MSQGRAFANSCATRWCSKHFIKYHVSVRTLIVYLADLLPVLAHLATQSFSQYSRVNCRAFSFANRCMDA